MSLGVAPGGSEVQTEAQRGFELELWSGPLA